MNKNLPIKIVLPRKDDVKNRPAGGGPKKFFCTFNAEVQKHIVNSLKSVNDYYDDFFSETHNAIPATALLIMKDEACAKSHTPDSLLGKNIIIGAKDINQFYIKISKDSIGESISRATKAETDSVQANMTAVQNIEPIEPNTKISAFLQQILQKDFEIYKKNIKIKLFDFDGDDETNIRVHQYVFRKLKEIHLLEKLQPIYHGDSKLYKLEVQNEEDIIKLSKIVGIQTVDVFYQYALPAFSTEKINFEHLDTIPHIDSDTVIGIIDGGIGDKNQALKPYVINKKTYVADGYKNNLHGAFIASTILYGNYLNTIAEVKPKRFKLLDIEALPNNDPRFGFTDSISEDELMEVIENTLKEFGGIVKLWNLSIGIDRCFCNGEISDFGHFLDCMQDTYGVQFFVSAGNVSRLEKWPLTPSLDDSDRIISPADSVRAVTVGSLAFRDSEIALSKKNEPSTFSRRGPGVGFTVKPEIVDYGGNWDNSGNFHQLGILGMSDNGEIVENIGTSFATPRALYKYACIYDELVEKDLLLSKALLVHSARINSRKIFNKQNKLYVGYGLPPNDYQDILQSSIDEVTVVFKQGIKQGKMLEMIDFPYPQSLIRDGKYYGEIFMTLVYNPVLDKNYGVNYCRSNIDASFGPMYSNKKYSSAMILEKNSDFAFEKERVKNGLKWAPVKSYYRNFSKGVEVGTGWKLEINRLTRYDVVLPEQDFILLLTIRDPNGNDIYSDMINGLREKSFVTTNLEIRSQVRQRQ